MQTYYKKKIACLVAYLLLMHVSLPVTAEVRLPAIIGSHMVLQQKSMVHLWGWCNPNEKITINTGWDTITTLATGTSGAKWKVSLQTPAAGGPFTITIKGGNTVVLEDVLIGEVWMCSGQSNMEMNINWGLTQYAGEVANAANASIRFFQVPKATADYPQDDTRGAWVVCTPDEMKRFSAAGYFFGRKLQQELQIPVGLINSSWGGTDTEVWTPRALVENDSMLGPAAAKIKPANGWPVAPGLTYNAMIYPYTGLAIAGAIWYQGESNVGTAASYRQLFTTMITAWRQAWQKDFPFYFVQIAPYTGYGTDNISGALLREAQTKSLSLQGTGMVLTADLVDDIKDIHPKLKKEVGVRLADYALAETYGKKNQAYKSPMYKSMKIEKDRIRIYFDNADGGLVSKKAAPAGFFIAGDDRKFVAAQAKIEGNTLVLWNAVVKTPVAARFGFSNAAMPDVFSKAGLPLNLFRTDDWPIDKL